MNTVSDQGLLDKITEQTRQYFVEQRFPVETVDTGLLLEAFSLAHPDVRFSQETKQLGIDIIRSDTGCAAVSLNNAEQRVAGLYEQQLDSTGFGNKLFKLLPNWFWALAREKRGILSFGGPWSNHLHALASLGAQKHFETIGLVRGERRARLTPTMRDAEAMGMNCSYIARRYYRQLSEGGKACSIAISEILGESSQGYHVVPAGGANVLGVLGSMTYGEVVSRVKDRYEQLWLACGTGGTLLGIANGVFKRGDASFDQLVGVNVLANSSLAQQQQALNARAKKVGLIMIDEVQYQSKVTIVDGALGGYSKTTDGYRKFYEAITERLSIPLDHIYMGKTLYALCLSLTIRGQANRGMASSNSALINRAKSREEGKRRIAVLHTGGVQGRRGYEYDSTHSLPGAA